MHVSMQYISPLIALTPKIRYGFHLKIILPGILVDVMRRLPYVILFAFKKIAIQLVLKRVMPLCQQ